MGGENPSCAVAFCAARLRLVPGRDLWYNIRGDFVKYIEKHPMVMILVGVLGIAMSSIFVKYSQAPSSVTAAC